MDYDFCILGAGIAGLSLADALQEQSFSVIVLEKKEVASGASGTPGGLVNPATGRKGKKTWKARQCYPSILENLTKVQKFSDKAFFKHNGLLRPALTPKMARKMHEQFDKTDWPRDWCRWQTEEQIKQRHPEIKCAGGGLWLPIGLTVKVRAYLKSYARYLAAKEVPVETSVEPRYQKQDGVWVVKYRQTNINCTHLVFATGYDAVHHPYWKYLPLEGVKGQVAKFSAPEGLLNFDHSISSMGYIAHFNDQNEFIQGSTYNHNFTSLPPDEEGEIYLRSRTRKVLPELAVHATLEAQWAGIRVHTPNRKPVLGAHPEIENLYLFTGLGSKGLLYGKYLAACFADHFKNGTALFPEVSIERF